MVACKNPSESDIGISVPEVLSILEMFFIRLLILDILHQVAAGGGVSFSPCI